MIHWTREQRYRRWKRRMIVGLVLCGILYVGVPIVAMLVSGCVHVQIGPDHWPRGLDPAEVSTSQPASQPAREPTIAELIRGAL
jgi:ABC-type Fe3+ transport system permease subunit